MSWHKRRNALLFNVTEHPENQRKEFLQFRVKITWEACLVASVVALGSITTQSSQYCWYIKTQRLWIYFYLWSILYTRSGASVQSSARNFRARTLCIRGPPPQPRPPRCCKFTRRLTTKIFNLARKGRLKSVTLSWQPTVLSAVARDGKEGERVALTFKTWLMISKSLDASKSVTARCAAARELHPEVELRVPSAKINTAGWAQTRDRRLPSSRRLIARGHGAQWCRCTKWDITS